ncbi:LPXTG cell wall anchor domain-containing protein [Lactobacillus xujianguonis]|uniref:LPXTG cell wall anchor domain-containing protein n=1 Tax=Lactobacillus xujianguonis TaxID=2495899 RepID=A0A437SVP2_9LACO|nr:LPXTG cell wall anchor domain-containing protein [Lactobacillus xujianguonis]RVU73941.1 LPXTG cell wall anchor domain-containing protein [Lactobacillus xujianguonis]
MCQKKVSLNLRSWFLTPQTTSPSNNPGTPTNPPTPTNPVVQPSIPVEPLPDKPVIPTGRDKQSSQPKSDIPDSYVTPHSNLVNKNGKNNKTKKTNKTSNHHSNSYTPFATHENHNDHQVPVHSGQTVLPETGEKKSNSNLGIIGLSLAAALALFGLSGYRKHND